MTMTEEGISHIPGLLSRWVRVQGGAKAHYVTAGETGPAVVLLHGGVVGSSGSAGWRYMAPFLGASGFRVYALDQLAFGLTDDPQEFYPLTEGGQVDFLHDFTSALCLDEFYLAGNSMGCGSTVNYVLAHPERVLAFALIAGVIGDLPGVHEAVRQSMDPNRPTIPTFDGTTAVMRAMMERIAYDKSTVTDDLVEMRRLAGIRNADVYAKWSKTRVESMRGGKLDDNYKARMNRAGRIDKITIPGIYLHGKNDVLFPYEQTGYRQEDALPNIQFFYPDNTGHQGQTDQPDLFNQLFLEFFRDGRISWDTAQRAGISPRRAPLDKAVAVPESVQAG